MCGECNEVVDTVTLAGLLKAVHVLYAKASSHPEACPQMIEAEVLTEIKQLDAGDLPYEIQAEGLREALRLVRSIFRYARETHHAAIAGVAADGSGPDLA